ncbi:MAG: hypothetical protein AAGD47_07915 [Pseudomonadota bacterium]
MTSTSVAELLDDAALDHAQGGAFLVHAVQEVRMTARTKPKSSRGGAAMLDFALTGDEEL